MDDFRFIHVSDPGDSRQSNQSVVRAHVMRAVQAKRREARKRLEQLKATKVQLVTRGVSQPQQGQHSYQALSHNRNPDHQAAAIKSVSPNQSFITSASASYPRISSLQHIEQLIQTYIVQLERGLPTRGSERGGNDVLRTGWLPAIKHSAGMFHMSIFMSSATVELLSGTGPSEISLFHRGQAIREVNRCLDDKVLQLADGTIGPIIALAGFECLTGNISALSQHVKAFTTIIKQRPRLRLDGFEGLMLKISIVYQYLLQAFGDRHTNSIWSSLSYYPRPDLAMSHSVFTFMKDEPDKFGATTPPSLQLLDNIIGTALAFDRNFIRNRNKHNATAFSSGCNVLLQETALMQSVFEKKYDMYFEATAMATMMYCCRGASNGKTVMLLKGWTAHKLRMILEDTDVEGYWPLYPGALIWCLLIGSTEIGVAGDRSWFRSQLLRAMFGLSMGYWRYLRENLHVLTWIVRCGQEEAVVERMDAANEY